MAQFCRTGCGETSKAPQCRAKFGNKGELMLANEHFEEVFNAAVAGTLVFQHPVKK